MSEISVPCAACSKPITFRDEVCPACLAHVPRDLRRALDQRLEASNLDYRELRQNIRSASTVVLLVAVMHIVWGLVRLLIEYTGDVVAISGGHTAGVIELVANFTIGAALLACFAWCKRAPTAALIGALAVWSSVQILAAIISPLTLFAGALLKLLGVILLVRGVIAAVKAAALMRRLSSAKA